MGKKDTITKEYMRNPIVFADAFNKYLYHGGQVITPENLYPRAEKFTRFLGARGHI